MPLMRHTAIVFHGNITQSQVVGTRSDGVVTPLSLNSTFNRFSVSVSTNAGGAATTVVFGFDPPHIPTFPNSATTTVLPSSSSPWDVLPTRHPPQAPGASFSPLPIAMSHSKAKSSLAAPLAGGIAGSMFLAGTCIAILLYRWHTKKRQHTLDREQHPEPFNTVRVDRLLGILPVIRKSLHKPRVQEIRAGGTQTPDPNAPSASEEPLSLPGSTQLLTSHLEATQRELRELKELVLELRVAGNVNGHGGGDTASINTAFTPPPIYFRGRGLSVPVDEAGPASLARTSISKSSASIPCNT